MQSIRTKQPYIYVPSKVHVRVFFLDEKINVTVQYYRTYSKLYTVAVTGTILKFNFFTS
jgi:hypothetical protein